MRFALTGETHSEVTHILSNLPVPTQQISQVLLLVTRQPDDGTRRFPLFLKSIRNRNKVRSDVLWHHRSSTFR